MSGPGIVMKAGPLGRLWQGLKGGVGADLAHLRSFATALDLFEAQSLSPEQAEGAARYADSVNTLCVVITSVVFIVGSLVLWATDATVLSDIAPHIPLFGAWRAGMIGYFAVALGVHLALPGFEWRRVRLASIWATAATIGATSGAFTALMGGLDHSYFYAIYSQCGISAVFFLAFRHRVTMIAALNIAYLMSYFLLRPGDLGHPELLPSLIVLAAASALYIVPGHLATSLLRQSWLQRRTLEAQARELERANVLNDHLLLTALPEAISRRLAAAGGHLGLRLKDITVLIWEPLGLGVEGDLASGSPWPEAAQAWLAHQAPARGMAHLEAFGQGALVVAGLKGHTPHDAKALAQLGEDLIAFIEGLGAPCPVGIYIEGGQALMGDEGGRPWLYDPWGTLLKRPPPWHKLGGGAGVLLSPTVARDIET